MEANKNFGTGSGLDIYVIIYAYIKYAFSEILQEIRYALVYHTITEYL